jgi:hypothetical protein
MRFGLVALVAAFATLSATSADDQAAKKPADTAPEWLVFKGTAKLSPKEAVLTASNGASFEMARADVRTSGDKVEVRNNAPAKVHPPKGPSAKDGCHDQDDCPSKCCACIGAVRVCCGEGGTRGLCFGAWGCP